MKYTAFPHLLPRRLRPFRLPAAGWRPQSAGIEGPNTFSCVGIPFTNKNNGEVNSLIGKKTEKIVLQISSSDGNYSNTNKSSYLFHAETGRSAISLESYD